MFDDVEFGNCKKRSASRRRKHLSKRRKDRSGGKRVSDNPTAGKRLDRIRKRLTAADNGYRNELCEGVAKSARIGSELAADPLSYAAFCRDPFWDTEKSRPKEKLPADAVRFAIKRAVPNGRTSQKTASFYYRAIRALIDNGVPPNRWAQKLKSTGFRELARRAAKSNQPKRQFVGEPARKGLGDAEFDSPGPHLKQSRPQRDGEEKRRERRKAATRQEAVLFLEAGSQFLSAPTNRRIWMQATIFEFGRRCEAHIHQWSALEP